MLDSMSECDDKTHDTLARIESMASETHLLIDEKMDQIILAVNNIGTGLQAIANQQKEFTRWLLAVVCAIALGSKLLEIVTQVIGIAK